MAAFPTLSPSAAPITPGAWPVATISSLNGAEARTRQGSAQIGRRLQLTFTNVTEANFLAILNHYRGQRSGFDSFGFDPTTLAADLTPAGYAWLYTSRPQVVDEHADVFTVVCEFKAEPRGLVVALGKAWRSAQTSLTRNVAPGVQWVNGQSSFVPGTGARFAAGVRWETSTVFAPQSSSMGAAWATSLTTFLPGNGLSLAAGAQWVTASTAFTQQGVNKGKVWSTSTTTLIPGSRVIAGGTPYTFTGGSTMQFTEWTGWLFTVSAPKVIKGLGFYDHEQNGLSGAYEIYLNALIDPSDLNAGYTYVTLDSAGTEYSIVSTTRPLSGVWRREDLAYQGATLSPGTTYMIFAVLISGSYDQIIKNAATITLPENVNYVKNFDDLAINKTTASDGIGYFGPMIFFE